MRLSFKYKYKKIFWLLLGFCFACICVQKVHAQDIDLSKWEDISNFTLPSGINPNDYGIIIYRQYNSSLNRLLVTNKSYKGHFSTFNSPVFPYVGNSQFGIGTIPPNSNTFTYYNETSANSKTFSSSGTSTTNVYNVNYIVYSNINIYKCTSGSCGIWFNTESIQPPLPDYLTGYKKITLSTSDRYYMLSGLSEGYVFIPTQAFLDYGGRLSYYDNDLDSQPYTSYIQDYITMPDGEYVRQSFNLSNYPGADWVMFSKYIYLEGEDNITYDIYVPNNIYDSDVEITPNNMGGNTFDFDYKDENGNIQTGQIISTDLSQVSPLLGSVFSDFSSNTFGLTSIITAPLGLIASLSSSSCSSLSLPLPYVNANLSLPCMTTIYQNTFGSFFTLYQTVTFGIIAYWVIVKIFNLVKDAKNPDHDEIEVIDL